MHRYQFDVHIDEKRINNAGSKATRDCKTILSGLGFQDLTIAINKAPYLLPLTLLKLFSTLVFFFIVIRQGSIIVVQYPLLAINRFFKYYIKLLKLKGCKVCCIIHDIDSLRSDYNKKKIEREIDALSAYDAVISHNSSMTAWLRSNRLNMHIEEIFLFDYLVATDKPQENGINNRNAEIAFAGNLGRGDFLNKLAKSDNPFFLNLYGSGLNNNILANNSKVRWFGSFTPDEIINEVHGNFGLIWDGDSTEEITGLMGNYVRYNTPHKTSLYLASGLPVIISANAAIAPFVEKNNIGICINSLSEISTKALRMDSQEYNKMKGNVLLIGEKLRKGEYLKDAVIRTENFLTRNK